MIHLLLFWAIHKINCGLPVPVHRIDRTLQLANFLINVLINIFTSVYLCHCSCKLTEKHGHAFFICSNGAVYSRLMFNTYNLFHVHYLIMLINSKAKYSWDWRKFQACGHKPKSRTHSSIIAWVSLSRQAVTKVFWPEIRQLTAKRQKEQAVIIHNMNMRNMNILTNSTATVRPQSADRQSQMGSAS